MSTCAHFICFQFTSTTVLSVFAIVLMTSKTQGRPPRRHSRRSTDCVEPDLASLWHNDSATVEATPDERFSNHTISHQPSPYEDTTCPAQPLQQHTDSLRDRSTCPWYTIVRSNRRMYPETITEAVCKCKPGDGCLGDAANQCELVRVYTKILWRTGHSVNGMCEYKRYYLPQAVGCTCARPQTVHADQFENTNAVM